MKVKHHAKGYRDLLTSSAITSDVKGRADRVASAAGGEREDFYSRQSPPRVRARAAVVAPMGDPDNKLIRSLDAGR